MASLNKVTLIGHVGKLPEITTTHTGEKFAKFPLATNESWKDKHTGEWQTKTDWHNIVVYNTALTNYAADRLQKGDLVYLEGQLKTRKWQGQDGVERYTTEVVLPQYNSKLLSLTPIPRPTSIAPAKRTPPTAGSRPRPERQDDYDKLLIDDALF